MFRSEGRRRVAVGRGGRVGWWTWRWRRRGVVWRGVGVVVRVGEVSGRDVGVCREALSWRGGGSSRRVGCGWGRIVCAAGRVGGRRTATGIVVVLLCCVRLVFVACATVSNRFGSTREWQSLTSSVPVPAMSQPLLLPLPFPLPFTVTAIVPIPITITLPVPISVPLIPMSRPLPASLLLLLLPLAVLELLDADSRSPRSSSTGSQIPQPAATPLLGRLPLRLPIAIIPAPSPLPAPPLGRTVVPPLRAPRSPVPVVLGRVRRRIRIQRVRAVLNHT